jgi:hypothetical protein
MSFFNMSYLFMKDWIFGYYDSTGVIAHENSLKPQSKVSYGVHYAKNLRAAASSSNILSLGGGLCNRRLLSRRPANERRSKKMISPRSAPSVNPTTHKISIRKANKIKRRRDIILNPKLRSVFEILENSLNYHSMRRVWENLKARTQPHGELNVRPYCCEVQNGVDHAPVLSLVHNLTIFIWTK